MKLHARAFYEASMIMWLCVVPKDHPDALHCLCGWVLPPGNTCRACKEDQKTIRQAQTILKRSLGVPCFKDKEEK